ncbi:MAG: MinD/ParA family protein [Rhodococcus sp. (in: high G+C Gram-positive bacteria)]|uniref:MinD/ParA family ATP-binding protein n=1 Tax=Rhodococcus sp. EPR-157 TaxID=1813677 RepID=UPI0007BBC71F|nr:MinD/ParA family protein [Rhodococcus sp. EPR-157]KZF05926.1 ATPase [Rhodococcus sp. EPR-157]
MGREQPHGTSAAWSIRAQPGSTQPSRPSTTPIEPVRNTGASMNGDRQSPPWQTPRGTDRQPPPRYTPPAEPGLPPPAEEWTPPWASGPSQQHLNDPRYQPTSQDLAPDSLLRRPKRASTSGWRRGVHRLTGGVINPGESTAEERYRNQVERIRQPVLGDYRIAFLSLKGGVGKTTTTLGLGSTFASLRGDCVIAVDANPDFGTLGERVPNQTSSTVRDLLADADNIRRYSDIRAHTSQAPSRLEVLAGERDPAASEMFGEQDYRAVIEMLQVYYNLILTDCGTGIMHSAMNGVLQLANALVLVSSPAVDGARSAAATLDWLQLHGYGHLVERTVVVISSVRPGSSAVDMNLLTQHFLERCRAVLVVPFDEHLAEGAVVDLELLRPQTRAAFVELAAMVADDFPAASGRHSGASWR